MTRACCVLATALSIAGCAKSEKSETTGATDPASAAPSARHAAESASVAEAPAAAVALPLGPQEEPPSDEPATLQAAREITKANYKTELGKIEKEIGAP